MANRSTTSVVIGWLDGGVTAGDFTESVARLAAYEVAKQRLATTIRIRSGPLLAEGRNLLVERFLEVEADWLLMVDSDMVFPHTTAERLLHLADPHSAPVVGGLCFGVNQEFGQFPTLYRLVDGLPAVWFDYPRDTAVQVDATGAAMLLMHRDVFVKYRRDTDPHLWFHRRQVPPCDRYPHGGYLSEDLSWCLHLRDHDVPIWVDTGVTVGHIKPTIVSEETYTR